MFRPFDNVFVETVANFTTHDPIIPYGVFAVNADGSGFKLGDGINTWSNLTYQGSSAIRNKQVQSSREPANNELLIFCDSTDKWIYRLQHCFDTVSNWESYTSVFPTSTLLIETANLTSIPTGRFKIGDGSTSFDNLPWFGTDFNLLDFAVGESIEFNGSGWDPVTYMKSTELQSATIPTGKFHKDDGTWATMDTFTGLETVEADQGVFSTVYVGGFPTESTTITLTSDGTDLFSDGQKVWTQYNDGHSSGLDADTLDGYHASEFLSTSQIEGLVYKGALNCATNPNFPEALIGDFYKISDDGLIGGEFGTIALAGYTIICNTNTISGDYASVGIYWDLLQPNIDGYVIGPDISTSENFVIFDGTSGGVIKDSNVNVNDFATFDHTHDISTTTASGFVPILENTTTKFLRDDGTWQTVSGNGMGDVTGPASSTTGNIVTFNTEDGKSIVDSGMSTLDFATSGDIETVDDNAFLYSIIFGG